MSDRQDSFNDIKLHYDFITENKIHINPEILSLFISNLRLSKGYDSNLLNLWLLTFNMYKLKLLLTDEEKQLVINGLKESRFKEVQEYSYLLRKEKFIKYNELIESLELKNIKEYSRDDLFSKENITNKIGIKICNEDSLSKYYSYFKTKPEFIVKIKTESETYEVFYINNHETDIETIQELIHESELSIVTRHPNLFNMNNFIGYVKGKSVTSISYSHNYSLCNYTIYHRLIKIDSLLNFNKKPVEFTEINNNKYRKLFSTLGFNLNFYGEGKPKEDSRNKYNYIRNTITNTQIDTHIENKNDYACGLKKISDILIFDIDYRYTKNELDSEIIYDEVKKQLNAEPIYAEINTSQHSKGIHAFFKLPYATDWEYRKLIITQIKNYIVTKYQSMAVGLDFIAPNTILKLPVGKHYMPITLFGNIFEFTRADVISVFENEVLNINNVSTISYKLKEIEPEPEIIQKKLVSTTNPNFRLSPKKKWIAREVKSTYSNGTRHAFYTKVIPQLYYNGNTRDEIVDFLLLADTGSKDVSKFGRKFVEKCVDDYLPKLNGLITPRKEVKKYILNKKSFTFKSYEFKELLRVIKRYIKKNGIRLYEKRIDDLAVFIINLLQEMYGKQKWLSDNQIKYELTEFNFLNGNLPFSLKEYNLFCEELNANFNKAEVFKILETMGFISVVKDKNGKTYHYKLSSTSYSRTYCKHFSLSNFKKTIKKHTVIITTKLNKLFNKNALICSGVVVQELIRNQLFMFKTG